MPQPQPQPQPQSQSRSQSQPDIIPIGSSVRLVSLEALSLQLHLPLSRVEALLKALRVPLLYPGGAEEGGPIGPGAPGKSYFSLFSLEAALFWLLRPGGPGWRPGTPQTENLNTLTTPDFLSAVESLSRIYSQVEHSHLLSRVRRVSALLSSVKPLRKRSPP